jgi:hypothetical protein
MMTKTQSTMTMQKEIAQFCKRIYLNFEHYGIFNLGDGETKWPHYVSCYID